MNNIIAKAYAVRIAPRKLRLLAKLIARKEVNAAELQLRGKIKHGSSVFVKLVRSAKANALRNAKIPTGTPLFIKEVRVDSGRVLKRFMPRAFGRATPIHKRSSHITLTLEAKPLKPKT
jgi:large subunit ribosomal protein L22